MSTPSQIKDLEFAAPPVAQFIQKRSLLVGVVFGGLAIIGAIINPAQFFRSFLVGYMLWLGMTLGCLAFLMLQHLTGGAWGMVMRRVLEAGSRTLWLMIVLFLPIILGIRSLYEWAHPEAFKNDEHLRHITELYLTPRFFILRAALYFVAWAILVTLLNRWSAIQDSPPERDLGLRFRNLSAPGLAVYAFTMTFAGIDFVMSIDPRWASSIYGLLIVAGQGLAGLSLAVIVITILARYPPMDAILKPANLRDYGNLMLTFVMLWAYFSFSQWLIIWGGNLPEEISWYLPRLHHGWNYVGLLLVLFHFAVPFALLLWKDFKTNPRKLIWLAAWLLVMRWLDLVWMIEPNFHPEKFYVSWMDFVVPIAIGGFWVTLLLRNLRERALVPLYDPRARAILEAHE